MDEFVVNKLHEWNLDSLIETFKENGVDTEVFNALDESMINGLIPQVGLRWKFNNKYSQYLLKVIENFGTLDSDSLSTISSASSLVSASAVDAVEAISNDSSFIPTRSLTGLEHLPQNKTHFDLRQFLNFTLKGKEVLLSFEKNTPKRSKLADILVENETSNNPDFRISTARFNELIELIARTFPNERPELYFIPWSKGIDGPLSARGILYDRYANRRRALREIGVLSKAKQPTTSDVDSLTDNEKENTTVFVEWLKNNVEPFAVVEERWKLTLRHRKISFSDCTISEYFEIFKCLKSPTGYTLLDQDFESMHAACANRLFLNWPTIALKIITIAQKRNDVSIKEYLLRHQDLIANSTLDVLTLMLLPLLLGTTCLKRKKGESAWRPSKFEVQESFILHVETLDDLQPRLDARNKKFKEYKLTNQPLPVIIGPISQIASSLVLIDETRYALPSPIKSIDTCFKAYFALNAKYPVESNHVWLFMEKYVYQIPSTERKGYVSVNKLISEIDAL